MCVYASRNFDWLKGNEPDSLMVLQRSCDLFFYIYFLLTKSYLLNLCFFFLCYVHLLVAVDVFFNQFSFDLFNSSNRMFGDSV